MSALTTVSQTAYIDPFPRHLLQVISPLPLQLEQGTILVWLHVEQPLCPPHFGHISCPSMQEQVHLSFPFPPQFGHFTVGKLWSSDSRLQSSVEHAALMVLLPWQAMCCESTPMWFGYQPSLRPSRARIFPS
jgi:hypothetical protein